MISQKEECALFVETLQLLSNIDSIELTLPFYCKPKTKVHQKPCAIIIISLLYNLKYTHLIVGPYSFTMLIVNKSCFKLSQTCDPVRSAKSFTGLFILTPKLNLCCRHLLLSCLNYC